MFGIEWLLRALKSRTAFSHQRQQCRDKSHPILEPTKCCWPEAAGKLSLTKAVVRENSIAFTLSSTLAIATSLFSLSIRDN